MIEDCMSKYLPCDKSNNKDESNHIQRQQSCYLISVYLKLALRKWAKECMSSDALLRFN